MPTWFPVFMGLVFGIGVGMTIANVFWFLFGPFIMGAFKRGRS